MRVLLVTIAMPVPPNATEEEIARVKDRLTAQGADVLDVQMDVMDANSDNAQPIERIPTDNAGFDPMNPATWN